MKQATKWSSLRRYCYAITPLLIITSFHFLNAQSLPATSANCVIHPADNGDGGDDGDMLSTINNDADAEPDVVDVNGNGTIDMEDGAILDLSATSCATLNSTNVVEAGGTYGFIFSNETSYSFTICPSATSTTNPQMDLWHNADEDPTLGPDGVTANSMPLAAVGVTNATTGCQSFTYTECSDSDNLLFLNVRAHSCLGNWDDFDLTITCTDCSLTCPSTQGISIAQASCVADDVIPNTPTINGSCFSNSDLTYFIDLDGMNGIMGATEGDTDGDGVIEAGEGFAVGADQDGLLPGTYDVTWMATSGTDCIETCSFQMVIDKTISCNVSINVGASSSCMATISPDDLLEGNFCLTDAVITPATYIYEVSADNITFTSTASVPLPGPHTMYVRVLLDLDGNAATTADQTTLSSCSTIVNLNDNSAPTCTIADPQVIRFCGEDLSTTRPTFTDCQNTITVDSLDTVLGSCSMYNTISIVDATDIGGNGFIDAFEPTYNIPTITVPAGFDLERVIIRTWTGTANGLNTNCDVYIYNLRPDPDDILAPISPVVLECNADTAAATLAAANPRWVPHYQDVDGNYISVLDQSHSACRYVAFTDDLIEDGICGNTLKIVRSWRVVDWCSGALIDFDPPNAVTIFSQVIETVDTTNPTWTDCPTPTDQGGAATNPIILTTSSANANSCFFSGTLSSPSATDGCSTNTPTIDAITYNATTNAQVTTGLNVQLAVGSYYVDFRATDDCDNTNTCRIYYEVQDDGAPVVVCKQVLTISIPSSGEVSVNASVFDNGSFDNCGNVYLKVKRMDEQIDCAGTTNDDFDDEVIFCCADVGDPLDTVILRVYDIDPSPYENANGMVDPNETALAGRWNECMVVVDVQDKIGPSITCPDNIIIECTQNFQDTTLTGSPITMDNCNSNLQIDTSDVRNLNMCGVGTVTRTWTATDDDGQTATCTQLITIQDSNPFTSANITVPPDVTIACTNFAVTNPDTSETGNVSFTNTDCKMVAINGPNDTRFEMDGSDDEKIIREWIIVEWCSGFRDTVEQEIWLTECMGCPDAVVFQVDQVTTIERACDAIPPTTGLNDLTVQIVGNVADHTFILTPTTISDNGVLLPAAPVTQLGTATSNTFTGLEGNFKIQVFLTASPPPAGCDTAFVMTSVECNSSRGIRGKISDETASIINNVEVKLQGIEGTESVMTEEGEFEFMATSGGNYMLTPQKNTDFHLGVSTYDLVLLSQHILGIETLSTPYKMIAADANRDGKITTFDVVHLRQLILYQIQELPDNTAWRFVKKSYQFPNDENPWQEEFPEYVEINNLEEDKNIDFVAVKVGDIDCSSSANYNQNVGRSTDVLSIEVENKFLEADQEYHIPFKINEIDQLKGLQFSLAIDLDAVDFIELTDGEVQNYQIGTSKLEEGIILGSWINSTNEQEDNDWMIIKIRTKQAIETKDIFSLTSKYLNNEAYLSNGFIQDVELSWGNELENNQQIRLYQNEPNPFSTKTNISFELPNAQLAQLTIFDANGKVLYQINDSFEKGKSTVELDATDYPKGILFYQLNTTNYSTTKKMILLD